MNKFTISGEAHGGYRTASYHVQDSTGAIVFMGTYDDCRAYVASN